MRRQGPAAAARAGGTARERGEISNWLTQMLVVLAVVGLVVYEAVALAFTTVQLDDLAREVAPAARDEYRAEQSIRAAREVGEQLAGEEGATVASLEIVDDEILVRLEKDARTLLVHRIGPLADRLTPSATRGAELRR